MFGFNLTNYKTPGKKPDTLFDAAINGDAAATRHLLAVKADINAKGEDGYTPLMAAAALGHEDIVQLLLDAKADINAVNNDGATALVVAVKSHQDAIASLLRLAGAAK